MLRGPFAGALLDAGFDDRLYERDRYGGCSVRAFEPSGFFRLERDDRWWFVTPDRHPFLSFGLNHADPAELLWPHYKRYWPKSLALTQTRRSPPS